MHLQTENLESKICQNCSYELKQNHQFCPFCGQSTKLVRISFTWLWNSFIDNLFNFEGGYIYTIKELTIRPGKTVRNYISGQRKKYYNPIKYLFLVTLIYFAISTISGYQNIKEPEKSGPISITYSKEEKEKRIKNKNKHNSTFFIDIEEDEQSDYSLKIGRYFSKKTTFVLKNNQNSPYIKLLLILSTSFISFLAFSRKKYFYNLFEHIVLYTYIGSHNLLLSALVIPIYLYIPILKGSNLLNLYTPIIYLWSIKSFFEISWLKSVWKSFVVLICSFIFIFLIMFIWSNILYFSGLI